MFNRLRLRLTLLYLCAAAALLTMLGATMYGLVAGYFQTTTDDALQYKMAFEFRQLGAPIPPRLRAAAQEITQRNVTAAGGRTDSSELAAIFVLPLDNTGKVIFNPNTFVLPISPDHGAARDALRLGYDWRTLTLADDARVRLLTYRLTRSDGPALLQVGRTLRGQDEVLRRLLLGLVGVACGSVALLGWGSWWLAGRSLRPAQQAWERQQAFIANASHEIRAPLTLLRASAEVAQRECDRDSTQHQLLDDVLNEADHMTRLVEDLLLLSRIDAQRLPVERAAVPLAPLVQDLVRQVERIAAMSGIVVVVQQVDGTVWGDPAHLRQVLLIVVENAVRHTHRGGVVHVHARPCGPMVEVSIVDTGEGIAPAHLPHLFERFYRVDSSRSDEQRGSGLGLSIARALVEAQGGQIRITSQVNVGTTVTLQFESATEKRLAL